MRFCLCLLFLLSLCRHSICRAQSAGAAEVAIARFSVLFPLRSAGLNDAARRRLDSLLYDRRVNSGQKLRIIGYADYLGSSRYNDSLSLLRAQAVKTYLVEESYIPDANITLVAGHGELPADDTVARTGRPEDRRADILVLGIADSPRPADSPRKPPAGTPAAVATTPPPARRDGQPLPTIDLTRLQVNETLRLPNLYFYPGLHRILPESMPVLDSLLFALERAPDLRIRIEGHVCCTPGAMDALDEDLGDGRLSLHRAEAIAEYLILKGIDPRRLETAGLARRYPIVPRERSESDAALNRRVEVRVLSLGSEE